MRTSALTAAAAAAALLGCAAPSASWIEVRSAHFRLQGDIGASQAEELVREFEGSYAALRSCMNPGGGDPPGVTDVVAFENDEDYRKIARKGAAAHFQHTQTALEFDRRIVFPANAELHVKAREEVLQHELTHRFVGFYMPNVPTWLNEGMAEFLSTAHFEGESVVMGEPPSEQWLSSSGWMVGRWPLSSFVVDPKELRSVPHGRLAPRGYVSSWMLVHVLVLGDPAYRKALEGYIAELRQAELSETDAFAENFDGSLLERVDAAYEAFQKRTSTPTQALALDAPPTLALSSRAIPKAEALAIHGRLWGSDKRRQNLALSDANQAIEADPKSPEGYLLRANIMVSAGKFPAAASDLRRALEFAPNDIRVRRGLGSVLLRIDGPSAETKGFVDWVRERAASADDYRLLASWESRMHRYTGAIELAKKGIARDVLCIDCYEIAAAASSGAGDFEGAVRFQKQAVNSSLEDDEPKRLERLSKYEQDALSARAPGEAEQVAITAAIRARRADFNACYKLGFARNDKLSGKVSVRFTVGADGTVTEVADDGSDLRDPEVVGCVVERVKALRFAPLAGGERKLHHYFNFRPSNAFE